MLGFDSRTYLGYPGMGGAGFNLQYIPDPVISVPRKTHPRKKRRIQKKFLARYGVEWILDPKVDLMAFYQIGNTLYCYRRGGNALLVEMDRRNGER